MPSIAEKQRRADRAKGMQECNKKKKSASGAEGKRKRKSASGADADTLRQTKPRTAKKKAEQLLSASVDAWPVCRCNSHSKSRCGVSSTCILRAQGRACGPNCPARKECRNRSVICLSTENPPRFAEKFQPTSEKKGRGVRSTRNLSRGQPVILIDTSPERRLRVAPRESSYILKTEPISRAGGGQHELEAQIVNMEGTLAGLVNHSCEPNLRVECWHVPIIDDNEKVIGSKWLHYLCASRPILRHEELCFDYNWQYYDDDPQEKTRRTKCLCGAKCCKGFI